ncbi:ML domain-containing protein [Kitasatospora sp. NPDC091207]|uniref:ML domain-containing protein n=1 Tax=Kitasatospora sp. NPDC091207 TaxID=3364083 RepID=UPI003824F461
MTGWSYENVGSETDALQIESITITPDPPQPGAELKGVIKGTVTREVVDGAYADVVVKLGLVKLLQKQFDLFAELKKEGSRWSLTADSGNGAPVAPGQVELRFDGRLPREIPRAKFTINVRAFTAEEEDLAGLNIRVDFLK